MDWNDDKKLTGDETVRGVQTKYAEGTTVVGFGLTQPGGRVDRSRTGFCLIAFSDDHLHVAPTGFYEGEVVLGSRKVKVAMVDYNVNGSLGETATEGNERTDLLLIDLDGDGSFAAPSPTDATFFWNTEVFHMSRMKQLPDGAYYRIAAAKDGSRLTMERDTRPVGTVRLAVSNFYLEVEGAEGPMGVRSSEGTATLPEGSYRLRHGMLAEKDKNGKSWIAVISPQSPRSNSLPVAAGKPASLNYGPPFRLELEIEKSRRDYSISLMVKDRGGNSVVDVQKPGGGRPAEPVLRLTSEEGGMVKEQKFHYG